MKAFINNIEVSIHKGATVRDLVLAYSSVSYNRWKKGHLQVYDRFENLTEADGPVSENQRFFLRRISKSN
jgi:hypothetical protein